MFDYGMTHDAILPSFCLLGTVSISCFIMLESCLLSQGCYEVECPSIDLFRCNAYYYNSKNLHSTALKAANIVKSAPYLFVHEAVL